MSRPAVVVPRPLSRRTDALRSEETRRLWLLVVLGVTFLMLPRATGWSPGHVHKEDGSIFLQDFLAGGWATTFDTYTGYLHVLARVLAGAAASATAGHPQWFPVVVAVLVSLVRVGVAVLAYLALRPYAASSRWALVAAWTVVLMPVGQWEVLGNLTNLRWVLVPGALFALLLVSRRPGPLLLATLVTVFAALGDPLMVLLAPVALARLVLGKGIAERLPALGFTVGAIVHLFLLEPSARGIEPYPLEHPVGSVAQWLVRGPVTATFGITGTEGLMLLGGAALASAAVLLPALVLVRAGRLPAFRRQGGGVVLLLVVSGIGILAATLLFADYDDIALTTWYSPSVPTRYAVPAATLIAPALVLAASHLWSTPRRRLDRVAAGLLAVAFAGATLLDLRGDPYNTQGPTWQTTMQRAATECRTSGERSLVVEVTPTGVPTRWDARITCAWVLGR